MKIEGEIADRGAIEAWKACVDSAPVKRILDFVAITPSLHSGFRPGKMTHKVAVDRVQAMLEQTGEMTVSLRALLSSIGLNGSLLSVLSEEAIGTAEGHMRNVFGGASIYSAMLLSDREGVRSMGIAGFAQGDFMQPTVEGNVTARAALSNLFRPFLEIVGRSVDMDETALPASVDSIQGSDGDTGNKSSQMKAELGEKSRQAKRLGTELTKTKAELEKVLAQNKGLEGNLEVSRSALATEKAAHQVLAQSFEQAVADETQRRVDIRVLPWLEPAEGLAAALVQSDSNKILNQAEALLSRQERADRRYGIWSQLVRERDACRAMIDRLSRARQESIQPLNELGAAANELAARVAELDLTLGQGGVQPVHAFVPAELSLRVKAATSIEELVAFRTDLEASDRLGFLQEEALSEIYKLIDKSCWDLYSKQPDDRTDDKDDSWQQMLPLHVLQKSLVQGKSCLLLIDGHNVLFKLRVILQLDFERNTPGPLARKQLVDKISALATKFPNLDTHLWYDGEDARDISVAKNIVVHYSGGRGSNRADEQIVKYLESIQYMRSRQQSQLKVLVTADRGLSRDARSQGGVIILAPEELSILFHLPNR
jgi:hypothetical protein